MKREQVRKWSGVLIGIGFANFVLWLVVSDVIGGSASCGMVQAGRFYVGDKSTYTHYTQVSHWIYVYSQYHTASLIVTHPLIFIGGPALVVLDAQEKAKNKSKLL